MSLPMVIQVVEEKKWILQSEVFVNDPILQHIFIYNEIFFFHIFVLF
jgi:hypothetical protein